MASETPPPSCSMCLHHGGACPTKYSSPRIYQRIQTDMAMLDRVHALIAALRCGAAFMV